MKCLLISLATTLCLWIAPAHASDPAPFSEWKDNEQHPDFQMPINEHTAIQCFAVATAMDDDEQAELFKRMAIEHARRFFASTQGSRSEADFNLDLGLRFMGGVQEMISAHYWTFSGYDTKNSLSAREHLKDLYEMYQCPSIERDSRAYR